MKQAEKEICLKKIYYFNIEINQNKGKFIETIEQEDGSFISQEIERNMLYKQSDCSRVQVQSYELAINHDLKSAGSRRENSSEDDYYRIDFCDEYKKKYLADHNQKIEGNQKYAHNLITFKTENGKKDETVILEDDQLFYCQTDNLVNLIQLISKSYKKIVLSEDEKENYQNDIKQLDNMKDIFNKGSISYFVIEKIVFRKYKKVVNNTSYTYDIPSVNSGDDIQKKIFTIVASSDYEFKNNLHILHKHDKLSAYSIQKTIEQRMNTIIYRSFKDIIRLCNYSKNGTDVQKYNNFYYILNTKRNKNESFFLLKDDNKISLKEVKSIVYKNACIEGLFPFNIYLNTFKENYFMNALKELVGKVLSDNSYKLTHHLSTQVGNLFYSYNDSGIFSVYKMQQKERSVSKSNDFTKIRVLDFFPLDQQIDEISEYIYNRLEYFDDQLHYFFTPDDQSTNQMDSEIKSIQRTILELKELYGIESENINVEERYEKLSDLIIQCDDILKSIKQIKMCNLIKDNFQEYINLIKQIVDYIKDQSDGGNFEQLVQEHENIYDSYEEDSYIVNTLCKTFLKFILTNNQVKSCYVKDKFFRNDQEDEDEEEESKRTEIDCQIGQGQGDGSAYTLLLRRLGFQFLSHYFGQFKYFHSWPIIITEIEMRKYQLLNNNCQTSGISFAYQIKELLKGFIEPLFIPEQQEFFEYYKQHFERVNKNDKLKYTFQSVESKSDIYLSHPNNIKNSDQNNIEQHSIVPLPFEQPIAHQSIKNSGQDSKLSIQNSSRQNKKFQIVLHRKYKEYYFNSLIENFSKYSSQTNTILNKSIYPLILEKPLPYHQFYGEKMAYEYLNAIISKDDYILRVYKIIVKDFPESVEEIEKIKQISFSVLGNDIIIKNVAFQTITTEAYNYIFNKPKFHNIEEKKANEEISNPMTQDFLSTLFMIYDALYFMRNKTYIENGQQGQGSFSGKVGSGNQRAYDLEQHFQQKDNNANSCSSISQKEKSTISEQKIFDIEKKKYLSSFVRHDYKDFFKELAFYYYNSIRMKHSTFTSREKLSYIGYLLIKDPKKKYK